MEPNKDHDQADDALLSRRAFLRAAGSVGTAGALAIAAGAAQAEQANAPPPAETGPPSKGYRETEHILKYYSTARYW